MGDTTDSDRSDETSERESDGTPDDAAASETVLLRDLAPRENVKGGSGKLRFGESKSLDPQDDS